MNVFAKNPCSSGLSIEWVKDNNFYIFSGHDDPNADHVLALPLQPQITQVRGLISDQSTNDHG